MCARASLRWTSEHRGNDYDNETEYNMKTKVRLAVWRRDRRKVDEKEREGEYVPKKITWGKKEEAPTTK